MLVELPLQVCLEQPVLRDRRRDRSQLSIVALQGNGAEKCREDLLNSILLWGFWPAKPAAKMKQVRFSQTDQRPFQASEPEPTRALEVPLGVTTQLLLVT